MIPYVIAIAGDSGVGKTSISNLIASFYGENNVLRINTDDLHKWPRNNPNWKKISHLNPNANNLELGDLHLKTLLLGHPIARKVYNHNSGLFDSPVILFPKEIIINEGLHSFYTDFSISHSNLKIFVDTSEELRIHWKILRDTRYRGYTQVEVLEAIQARRKDSEKLREKQMENADLIIKISTENPIIHLGSEEEKIQIKTELEKISCANGGPLIFFLERKL